MVLSDWTKQLATSAFLIAFPSIAVSDTQQERLLALMFNGDNSKFSTPVTILKDHPRCDGPGQVAFSLDIEAKDLDFEVSGGSWSGTVWQIHRFDALSQTDTCIVGSETLGIRQSAFDWDERPENVCDSTHAREQVFQKDIAPEICYRTERRGVEVSSIRMECPNDKYGDNSDSLNALLRAADIEINMSATAIICHTISGAGLLDSAWVVTIGSGDQTDEFTGVFGPNRWFDPPLESPIKVRLVYNWQDTFLMNVSEEISNGPFPLDPMRSGSIRLSFEIDQFVLADADAPPVKLEAHRGFRLDIRQ